MRAPIYSIYVINYKHEIYFYCNNVINGYAEGTGGFRWCRFVQGLSATKWSCAASCGPFVLQICNFFHIFIYINAIFLFSVAVLFFKIVFISASYLFWCILAQHLLSSLYCYSIIQFCFLVIKKDSIIKWISKGRKFKWIVVIQLLCL